MKTRNNLVFIFLLFLLLNTTAQALIVNEIMYDPDGADTDREWIELLNDTPDTIDLTSWKFFEANTNHGLTAFQGGMLLSPGGYAVISSNPSKFLAENTTFQGILIKSSFSLSNSGEYLAMKNNTGAIQDSLTYIPSLGGQDDGSTLSLLSGVWARGERSPGGVNIPGAEISPATKAQQESTDNQMRDSNSNSPTVTPVLTSSNDLSVYTVNEKIVTSGADAEFTARASISGKKAPETAEYLWSFGDGGTRIGKSVGYHYHYPGVYIAMVEVSADGMVATAKTRVRVVDPEISITGAGQDGMKNYVEIYNKGQLEVDISNWKLTLDKVFYPIPKNTIIMAKQKVRFSGSALGFASTTISSSTVIQLLYPNYGEVLRYVASSTNDGKKQETITSSSAQIKQSVISPPKKSEVKGVQYLKAQPTNATSTKQVLSNSWLKRFLSKL